MCEHLGCRQAKSGNCRQAEERKHHVQAGRCGQAKECSRKSSFRCAPPQVWVCFKLVVIMLVSFCVLGNLLGSLLGLLDTFWGPRTYKQRREQARITSESCLRAQAGLPPPPHPSPPHPPNPLCHYKQQNWPKPEKIPYGKTSGEEGGRRWKVGKGGGEEGVEAHFSGLCDQRISYGLHISGK